MVVAAHRLDFEQGLPDLRQDDFRVALRRFMGAAGVRLGIGRRQRLAVELAVRRQRQCGEADKRAGQHVFGQLRRQLRTQGRRVQARPGLRHHIGHQAFVARGVFAHDHRRFLDPGTVAQPGLDLAQFDTEPTDLDLEVVAAQVFEASVRTITGQVTGLVQARIGLVAERIGQEAFGADGVKVQVTARHTVTTDEDFPMTPNGTGWRCASSR